VRVFGFGRTGRHERKGTGGEKRENTN